VPAPPAAEQEEEEPATRVPPILEAPEPEIEITTTVVVPGGPKEPR
jgi:hypothetical protein